ncbi:DUF3604 domain-containing protein [Gammaproteobacteria bacterium]|nr:DUF3604 domain-containing protein [Gammaproteobacteria bacterium]
MKNLKIIFVLIFIINSCSESASQIDNPQSLDQDKLLTNNQIKLRPAPNPDKNAYFGDLHVHTENSFDAYSFGTISTPNDAYRYAQGQTILHPTGYQIQLSRPLDFYAVTDHAMFMGLLKEAADTSSKFSQYKVSEPFHNLNESVNNGLFSIIKRANLFRPFARGVRKGLDEGIINNSEILKVGSSVWKETIKAADNAYVPGTFTTFAGYEYSEGSASPILNTLHRNVIFRDTENLPKVLFSRLDSNDPEKLWDWMDNLRAKGVESLAIPHNSNLSGGLSFMLDDFNGVEIDEGFAQKRALNEPLAEITQVKGTSETHPLLSKNDEWASFELGATISHPIDKPKGSYIRDAYLRGLALGEKGITNPYKFGLIGSSDTHVGGGSDNEEVYFSKIGLLDGTAELRGSIPFRRFYGTIAKVIRPESIYKVDGKNYLALSDRLIQWSASGVAGVWAQENTRESIYDAFRRKETFATSGPRIKVRFFAGYGLENLKLENESFIKDLYVMGTSMGGTLSQEGNNEPTFLVWAIRDPLGAPLQRTQIIKGWLKDGEHREKVFDVSCSDGLSIDPETYRCPDNGARVDLTSCSISANKGATELKTFWKDPDFKEDQEAFYYTRVLENPVCRWSTWDAIRVGSKPRSDIPAIIQERAWSSPIWFKPKSN